MHQDVTDELERLLTDNAALGRRAAEAILASDLVVAAAVRAIGHRDTAGRA